MGSGIRRIPDNRNAAQRSRRRTASHGIGSVGILGGGYQGAQGGPGIAGVGNILIDRSQRHRARGHRCIIHGADTGRQINRIVQVRIGGRTAGCRAAQIGTGTGRDRARRTVDQPYRQLARGPVPVGSRQETYLVSVHKQERRRKRRRSGQISPASPAVVLPLSLGCRGGIRNDGNPGQRVCRRAPCLCIGIVIEDRCKQTTDAGPGRCRGIFLNACQRDTVRRAQGRIIDWGDGNGDRLGIGFRATRAGIAQVIDGNAQALLITCPQGIGIGRRRKLQGCQGRVDIGLGTGEHHLGISCATPGRERQSGQGPQSQRPLGRRAEIKGDFFLRTEIVRIAYRDTRNRIVAAVLVHRRRRWCRCNRCSIDAGNLDCDRACRRIVAIYASAFDTIADTSIVIVNGDIERISRIRIGVDRGIAQCGQGCIDIGS